MALDGEGYTDKEFFKLRYRHLKELGTPGLTKRTTTVQDEGTSKWRTVWIIEYEAAEEPAKLVN